VQRTDHSLPQKQRVAFVSLSVFGVAALLLGLALIIFAHYHERAYVFLGLGAGCFIGGIAAILEAGSKVKVALSYGMIAMGMMGIVIGLNYLVNRYGPAPNQTHGYMVIALSVVTILAGIAGALIAQPKGSKVAFSRVVMLGGIASIGVVALVVGTVYLVVLQHQGHAYPLLGIGTACLISGLTYSIFVQSRVRLTSR
jgi:hypothetical protein